MTISVELPPDVEATFAEKAQAKGVSLDEFVRDYLIEHAPIRIEQPPINMENDLRRQRFHRFLAEVKEIMGPNRVSLSDEAISRDSIYTREDEIL